MSDHNNINVINNLEASKLNPDETSKKQNQEDDAQSKCVDALKNSVDKNKSELNKTQAIEKLDFTKETLNSTELKRQVDNLIEVVKQTNPKDMVQLTELQNLVNQAFQNKVTLNQEINEGLNVTLNAAANNPFKLDNPFAPKIITKTKEATQADLQKEKNVKSEETNPNEPLSFKKILHFLFK
ncbi:MAG: hypothetical protein WC860_01905 [Candidatus Margulisiibacteriota bacterium]|jgi:hypothetical protein